MKQTRRGARAPGAAVRVERLAAARAALARAEDRAGLHGRAAREVAQAFAQTGRAAAVSGAVALAAPDALPEMGAATPAALLPLGADAVGAVSLTGSAGALLAVAALRQGAEDWCGVVGCEGLGWCAAAEAGLDLSRVLAVPAADLPSNLLTSALGALMDGVAVLLISATAAARLRPRDRRTLLARARERRCLILTPFPWEGSRTLHASSASPASAAQTGGVLVSLRGAAVVPGQEPAGEPEPGEARELADGYLRRLTWSVQDPHRPGRVGLLFDAAGARLAPAAAEAPAANSPRRHSHLALVTAARRSPKAPGREGA
ncbi:MULTISPECIES: hypothetical protein [unclassified Actinomyces]|uniref:hypothetical protein n=1 Tax=unclassified Actinomyces TaxID=2609248 RepID=UPI000D59762D|nr:MULTISPECIES: hypothetical protein [unclassified Actinomyces]RAX19174.1 hypothetical protein DRB06_14520 [Actinomyces sp. Z5]RAX20428.1 hypothetical protein DRB07_14015 [Actinomyces sp. Z3]